jgi:anti-anti-sigma factor
MTTASELEDAINSAGESTQRVTVNLSDVTFLDSSALNSLLRSNHLLTGRKIPLRLVIPTENTHIRKVFEITQLTDILGVVETLDQALAQASPGPAPEAEPV